MSSSDIDIASLNEDQQLALQQYTAVTDQDLASAIPLLQKCQWNVQIAITRFFDGDAGTVDPVAEAARAPPIPIADERRAETLINTIPVRGYGRSGRTNGLEAAPRVVATPENWSPGLLFWCKIRRPSPPFLRRPLRGRALLLRWHAQSSEAWGRAGRAQRRGRETWRLEVPPLSQRLRNSKLLTSLADENSEDAVVDCWDVTQQGPQLQV